MKTLHKHRSSLTIPEDAVQAAAQAMWDLRLSAGYREKARAALEAAAPHMAADVRAEPVAADQLLCRKCFGTGVILTEKWIGSFHRTREAALCSACAGMGSALPTPDAWAEPVFWCYQHENGGPPMLVRHRNDRPTAPGWTETPLYASPPSPQSAADARADALREAAAKARAYEAQHHLNETIARQVPENIGRAIEAMIAAPRPRREADAIPLDNYETARDRINATLASLPPQAPGEWLIEFGGETYGNDLGRASADLIADLVACAERAGVDFGLARSSPAVLLRPDGWRTMASAPKDRGLWLYWPSVSNPDARQCVGWWTDDPRNGGYWMDVNDSERGEPSHWRDLPAAPLSSDGGEGS